MYGRVRFSILRRRPAPVMLAKISSKGGCERLDMHILRYGFPACLKNSSAISLCPYRRASA